MERDKTGDVLVFFRREANFSVFFESFSVLVLEKWSETRMGDVLVFFRREANFSVFFESFSVLVLEKWSETRMGVFLMKTG
jgi:hypothetical protein